MPRSRHSKPKESTPPSSDWNLGRLSAGQPIAAPVAEILARELACPRCGQRPCGPWGRSHGLPRHRCPVCGKTFNALTGTSLAHLRLRDRWATFVQALIDGDSVRGAARRCGVDKSTAFRWRQRFLALDAERDPSGPNAAEGDDER